MNIIITSLFPSRRDISETKETKAIYNLVNNEKEILILYPVILPSTLKNLFNHLKYPIFRMGTLKVIKVPIFKIPKKELYLLFPLKIVLLLLKKLKGVQQVTFHRVNIAFKLSEFLNENKMNFNFVVHASDIHLIEKFPEKVVDTNINFRSHSLKKKTERIVGYHFPNSNIAFSGIDDNHIINFEDLSKKKLENGKLKIVTVCSLIKLKNVNVVLESLAKWENDDWEYTVIGNGPELQCLKNLSHKLGINDKVIFTGEKSHENVMEILEKNHLFIMLSRPETFGLVYLEAMSKGCIVFCASENGIDGIIKNEKNGFIIKDPEELLTYFEKLIDKTNYYNIILENSMKTINNYTNKIAKENYFKKILYRELGE